MNVLNYLYLFKISSFDSFGDIRLIKICLLRKYWKFLLFGKISRSLGSIDRLTRYNSGLWWRLFMLNPMVFFYDNYQTFLCE